MATSTAGWVGLVLLIIIIILLFVILWYVVTEYNNYQDAKNKINQLYDSIITGGICYQQYASCPPENKCPPKFYNQCPPKRWRRDECYSSDDECEKVDSCKKRC